MEYKYHVVYIPECHRRFLYVQLSEHPGEVFRRLADQKKQDKEGHFMIDHICTQLSIRPKYAVFQIVCGKRKRHIPGTESASIPRGRTR